MLHIKATNQQLFVCTLIKYQPLTPFTCKFRVAFQVLHTVGTNLPSEYNFPFLLQPHNPTTNMHRGWAMVKIGVLPSIQASKCEDATSLVNTFTTPAHAVA